MDRPPGLHRRHDGLTAVVGYVRASTDDQEETLLAQREDIERWTASEGLQLLGVFVDKGVSGAAPVADRAGLSAALNAIEEAGGALLVATKRDRLARDAVLMAMLEAIVGKLGGRVTTVVGAADGDGPEDFLLRRIQDVFSEYERLVIGFRTKRALAQKKARGERIGNIPFGSTLAEDGKLVPDPAEEAVVRLVMELDAKRMSYREICAFLAGSGAKPRGSRWWPQTISTIIKRERKTTDLGEKGGGQG